MEINVSDLVSKVIKKLDENEEIISEKTEFGYPGTSLPVLIADILPECAESVVLDSPLKDIDEWLEMDSDFEWIAPGHGQMELPDNCLRLVAFRMSDWKRSVSSVVLSDSPVYSLRFSPRGNRRGVRKSPAVAIVEGAGRRRLEFVGSTDPGAYVEIAGYVPLPAGGDDEQLWIPRGLVVKVVDAATAKIREIRG